ncbi:MAG: putative radical family enzyme, coproporphyrinogen oxidase, oxygen-independent [Firmicutes bacterium]|nr:putative radical family enzyme, coproporphyrinogen oxidase, oxygen-independent [Bacillota bacterium]
MKLYFEGHGERYAVEQSLLTLFPGERPMYPEVPPSGDNELELSLEEGPDGFSSRALLRRDGHCYEAHSHVPSSEGVRDVVSLTRLRRRCLQEAFYLAAVKHLGYEPPWGMLSGVRPVKLPVRAVLGGATLEEAEVQLQDRYRVSPLRRELAMDCAREALAAKAALGPRDISLYIGIPFCPTRCAYCSFISAAGHNNRLIEPYLAVLHDEIRAAGARVRELGVNIHSVYIGGGTPTTLSPSQLSALLGAVREAFSLSSGIEFTVEAGRPDTMTREVLTAIRDGGGNRISLNPQTMSDQVLRTIGRAHTAADTLRAWELVQAVGFPGVNMDLIAGLPGDDLSGFQDTLSKVLALGPENVTVHTLALKRGSRLKEEGSEIPSGSQVAEMLDFAWAALRKADYLPYYLYRQKFMSGALENVGWCKEGLSSVYNICMMEELHSILSLGAGGVTKIIDYESGSLRRFSNPKYPQEYIREGPRMIQEKRELLL